MAIVARILGVSLLTVALGACLGAVLFKDTPDSRGISFVLGCIGAIVGVIAGVGLEIVTAIRQKGLAEQKDFG